MAIIAARDYKEGCVEGDLRPSEIGRRTSELEPDSFSWVGLFEPTAEEMSACSNAFKLHPLAVEDALHAHILKDVIAADFRSPALIASTTAVFGIVLWMADRRASKADGVIGEITWRDAMLIGVAQALALVPGVSRSGITITAALFLGVQRSEAARFSLLLSIPTTAAAGALGGYELIQSGTAAMLEQAALAAGLAFISALAAIAGLMKWLSRSDFTPFVIYRLLLAVVIVVAITSDFIPV